MALDLIGDFRAQLLLLWCFIFSLLRIWLGCTTIWVIVKLPDKIYVHRVFTVTVHEYLSDAQNWDNQASLFSQKSQKGRPVPSSAHSVLVCTKTIHENNLFISYLLRLLLIGKWIDLVFMMREKVVAHEKIHRLGNVSCCVDSYLTRQEPLLLSLNSSQLAAFVVLVRVQFGVYILFLNHYVWPINVFIVIFSALRLFV